MAHQAPEGATMPNRYGGTCDLDGNAVEPGAGFVQRVGGRWVLRCAGHESHGALNPWREQGQRREMDYTGDGYTPALARAAVALEYRDTDAMAEPCECGGKRWWKATVCAPICPSCGAMRVGRAFASLQEAEAAGEDPVVATRAHEYLNL